METLEDGELSDENSGSPCSTSQFSCITSKNDEKSPATEYGEYVADVTSPVFRHRQKVNFVFSFCTAPFSVIIQDWNDCGTISQH